MPDYSQRLYPPDYRNLVMNPSGRATFSSTWLGTNGTVEEGSDGTSSFGAVTTFTSVDSSIVARGHRFAEIRSARHFVSGEYVSNTHIHATRVNLDGTTSVGADQSEETFPRALRLIGFVAEDVFIAHVTHVSGPKIRSYHVESDLSMTIVDELQWAGDGSDFSSPGAYTIDTDGTVTVIIENSGTHDVRQFTVDSSGNFTDGTLTSGSQQLTSSLGSPRDGYWVSFVSPSGEMRLIDMSDLSYTNLATTLLSLNSQAYYTDPFDSDAPRWGFPGGTILGMNAVGGGDSTTILRFSLSALGVVTANGSWTNLDADVTSTWAIPLEDGTVVAFAQQYDDPSHDTYGSTVIYYDIFGSDYTRIVRTDPGYDYPDVETHRVGSSFLVAESDSDWGPIDRPWDTTLYTAVL